MLHLAALLLTFALLATVAAACVGSGRALRRAVGLRPPAPSAAAPDAPFLDLWLGWAVLLGALQFVHLFAPLRAWSVVPLLALGLVAFFALRPPAAPPPPASPRARLSASVAAGLWLLAALWIASRAMQTPLEFDAGLYHFQSIRWHNETRLTPGLGNLHGRLAFNSAFYSWVAALNFPPLFGHGRALANTFLLLAVLAQALHRLHRAAAPFPAVSAAAPSDPALAPPARPLAPLAALLALPVVAWLAVSTLGLASPSADLAACAVQVALFLLLAEGLDAWRAGHRDQDTRFAGLALLGGAALALKLSNAGFVLGLAALGAAYLAATRPLRAPARAALALACALGGIWIARGYLLSGHPAYPSPLGALPFDWTVPAEQARYDANAVYSWARQPWADMKEVLGNTRWLRPWFRRAAANTEGLVAPLAVTVLALAAALALRVVRPRRPGAPPSAAPLTALLFVPLATGLLFWWFTAPDPRFAHAQPSLLPLAALLLLAAVAAPRLARPLPPVVLLALAVAVHLHFALWVVRHPERLADISRAGWQLILPAGFTPRHTASGLVVHTYRYHPDELIWDGPRPATPDYNPRLRLRDPDRPELGFTQK